MIAANPFTAGTGASVSTGKLQQMAEPLHRVLAKFIHDRKENPTAQTAAVSTLVFSLWQAAGTGMTHRQPSLLLVGDSGQKAPTPLDEFAASLVNAQGYTKPEVPKDGPHMFGTIEGAPTAMEAALRQYRKRRTHASMKWVLEELQMLENHFFAAQKTGFGSGPTRPYAAAWHEIFGLMTERDCQAILRLESDEDRSAFRRHVVEEPEKLQAALGYGPELELVSKRLSISGTLSPTEWDQELADAAVDLGMPMIFLPVPAGFTDPIEVHPALEFASVAIPKAFGSPLEEPVNFAAGEWFSRYADALRIRLRALPPEYEFATQRMARQILPVCLRLAGWMGRFSGASAEECDALALDLCTHALRGLVISIAGLVWHGYGLDVDVPREQAMKVLDSIRNKGPMSRSDVARRNRLSKETRDALLKSFEAEDLVRVEGKVVTATTYPEFVEALYARAEFPEPPCHWDAVGGEAAA